MRGEPSHVDWSRLEHAYGSAEETPVLLERLRGEDWEEALGELFASLLHQGSVYPATLAALPLLVDIAHDPAAPGRMGALWLLGAYARSIAAGAGRVATYLPEGVDVEVFGRRADAALDETARNLLPLVADADPHVRAEVYGCTAHVTSAAGVVPVLRARFERELDGPAAVALVEPLVRHGAFDAADLATLIARGDDAVVFAAVWSAVAAGHHLPGAVDHLVRLWPDHAGHYPEDGESTSLDLLAGAAGARAVPVLRRLQAVRAAQDDDLIGGWATLAGVSRSAAVPALEGLLEAARRAHAPEVTSRLVSALAEVLPAAPELAPRTCDAIARIAEDTPARGPAEVTVLASAAVVLFAARDRRWAAPARAVVAASAEEPMAGGDRWARFSTALIGFPADRRATAWAARELVDLAGRAIAAWPGATAGWVEVLAALPADEAVVRTALTAVDHASTHELLARIGVDHPEVFTPELRARAGAALRTARPGDATAWLTTARDVLDPTDARDAAFDRAWELDGGDEDGSASLLAVWARRPVPSFHAACLRLLDGVAPVSLPARQRRLAAARAVVDAGDAARAWSTVRAIVDQADSPLPEAIAVGNRIVDLDASRRREWVDLLHDIVRHGREDWSGPDHRASAVALEALQDLGEVGPDEAADLAITALLAATSSGQVVQVAPVAARVLRTALTARPDLRDHVARALAPILDTDLRVPTSSDSIADDVRVHAALRGALR